MYFLITRAKLRSCGGGNSESANNAVSCESNTAFVLGEAAFAAFTNSVNRLVSVVFISHGFKSPCIMLSNNFTSFT